MGGPLRILHVVVNMNRGGAETLIMNLYRNMDRSKVQFDFLTCKPGVFDTEIKELGGRVYRIPYVTEAGHKGFNRALKQFMETYPEYRIIHSHLDKMSGFVLRAAKKANIPVRIAHSHNTQSEGGLVSKVYKWYAGTRIKNYATHCYACSIAAADWLFQKRSTRAHILKNGIETDKFMFSLISRNTIRKELGIDKNAFVIGHVGRMAEQKNHLFLLDIFKEVSNQIPHAVLLLAGEGPLRGKVEEKISILNLTNKVMLLGVREDINKLLHAFDIFVFPSLHEGLPVTLVEAQGAELPCLISDVITKEVDMGAGLVEYLPLADDAKWVQQIANYEQKPSKRIINPKALAENGYDIRETAKETQLAYMEMGDEVG